jgi:hypothetical protein
MISEDKIILSIVFALAIFISGLYIGIQKGIYQTRLEAVNNNSARVELVKHYDDNKEELSLEFKWIDYKRIIEENERLNKELLNK